MWGRVIEHTFGARSRFAYPARLRLVCGPCLAVGAGAVTPVRVLGEHGSLKAVCQAHWSGPTARADPAADVEAELLSTYGVELLPIEQLSGGLRIRPVRTTRPSVPAATQTTTSRFDVGRLLIGLYFVARVIGALLQPASDASAAQPDVTSSPPALESSSRSMTGDRLVTVTVTGDRLVTVTVTGDREQITPAATLRRDCGIPTDQKVGGSTPSRRAISGCSGPPS